MVSNKNADRAPRRPYRLKARAQRREQVRRRITEATVHLHGTVGPARTTVSDIAKRAGVRRGTVYNHFPTDLELFDACSSHWFAKTPPPDPAPWTEIGDPSRRAEAALIAMYEYYDSGQRMLENVMRDRALVPAVDNVMARKWEPMLGAIVEILAAGWGSSEPAQGAANANAVDGAEAQSAPKDSDTELRASLRVALDFFTWQTLSSSGLSNEHAARLATAWVEAAPTLDSE